MADSFVCRPVGLLYLYIYKLTLTLPVVTQNNLLKEQHFRFHYHCSYCFLRV